MRSYKKGVMAAKLVALIGLVFLTGCGSGGGGSKLPPIGNVPGGSGGFSGGGCVPIQSPIPFNGQNIHFDHYNLVGGQLPPTDSWPIKPEGIVRIGGGTTGGYGTNQLYGTSMDGTIQMTVSPIQQQTTGGYPGTYPSPYTNPYQMYSTRANVQGTLTLSAAVQQEIMYYMGGYNTPTMPVPGTYPGQYPQQPYPQQQMQICASGVAFNMGYQVNMPYGKVYLYLNNTQHGIVLVF